MPRLPADLVPRPRLTRQLDLRAPLTLVRAPLGFGKTTLVAQWVTAQHDPGETIAWLHVDEDTGSADGAWPALLHVLVRAGVPMPQGNDDSRPARALVTDALQSAGPIVVVVDNFEQVNTDGIDRALLDLLRRIPHLRLIVTLRSQRHFHPHDRLGLDTVELTARELQFTVHESNILLTSAEPATDHEIAKTIHADVDGWPEPIRAAAAALRHRSLAGKEAHELAAREHTEFLRHRLLPPELADRANFVLATSIPETFTAEIAQLLTDDEEADHTLGLLEGDGMLTAMIEDGQPVYRWPPAARRALLLELERREPHVVPTLRARMAGWYDAHGQPALALEQATQAQDWPLVVRIIEGSWRQLYANHRDLLRAAHTDIPFEAIASSPRVLATRDLPQPDPDDRVLDMAPLPESPAECAALGRSDRAADVLDIGVAMLSVLRRHGLFVRAREYADRLEKVADAAMGARPADVIHVLPSLQLQIGIAAMLADDLSGALGPLTAAYELRTHATSSQVERDAAGKIALLHGVAGRTRLALHWVQLHDAAPPAPQGWMRRSEQVTGDAARLLAALDRLEISRAAEISERLIGESEPETCWAFIVYAQAQLNLHTLNALGMLEHLDLARTTHRGWLGGTATPLLAAAEADLLISLGRGNEARAAIRAAGEGHPLLQVPRARLALLSGRADAALRVATDNTWTRTATLQLRMQMLLIQAIAAYRLHDLPAAVHALRLATRSAHATGSLRAFTTGSARELSLLAQHAPDAEALLDIPKLRAARYPFPSTVTLVDLTTRERLVLTKISEGLPLQQVGATLFVSINTVKSQLRSLYHKLNVDSRDDAIARARQWGLLTTTPRSPNRAVRD